MIAPLDVDMLNFEKGIINDSVIVWEVSEENSCLDPSAKPYYCGMNPELS